MSFGGSFAGRRVEVERNRVGRSSSGGRRGRSSGGLHVGHGTASRTIARTGSEVRRQIRSANWGGRDRHFGSADGDDEPKRAHGVGEGRPPWLSALPVDGGVLVGPHRQRRPGNGLERSGGPRRSREPGRRSLRGRGLRGRRTWVFGGRRLGFGCGGCGVVRTPASGGRESMQEFGLGGGERQRREDEEKQGRKSHIRSSVRRAIKLLGANTRVVLVGVLSAWARYRLAGTWRTSRTVRRAANVL